ncbi:MAG: hypothetical protein SFY69_02045 [Planctomycetota bacterium]|nr:hypothetical protein [Planctomycetota bacterium]
MLVRSLVVGAGLAASLCALAQPPKESDCGVTTPASARTPRAEHAMSLREQLRGEWDGQIQVVTAEGASSTGYASMSVRPREGRLILAFEGVAGKKVVEGVGAMSFQGDEAASVVDSAILGAQRAMMRVPCEEQGVLVFRAFETDAKGSPEIEQVVRMPDANAVRIEFARVHADGRRERLAVMDMIRLPAGEVAMASAMLQNEAKIKAVGQQVQASVPATDE